MSNRQRISLPRITARRMTREFGPAVNVQAADNKTVNFVAMDYGRFHLKSTQKEQLIRYLAQLQRDGHYDFSLVPSVSDNNCIFFADIDLLPENVVITDVIDKIITCVNDVTRKDPAVTAEDLIIFKREDADKYHVYIPGVVTSKAQRKAIGVAVNQRYPGTIDLSASCIRFEGFLKFDAKNTRKYIPGSRYFHVTNIPADGSSPTLAQAIDEDLLRRVWLEPRGWNDAARQGQGVLLNDNNNAAAQQQQGARLLLNDNNNAAAQQQQGAGLLLNDDNNAEGKQDESAEVSPDAPTINPKIKAAIANKIQAKFPEIARTLWRYPIKSIGSLGNRNWSFNMADKSRIARTCNIKKVVHRSSNIWLMYNKQTNVLQQRCYSAGCTNKFAILTAPPRFNGSNAASAYQLPEATDTSLAECFKNYKNGHVAVQDNEWFEYRSDPGYWVTITVNQVAFWLCSEFREYLQGKFADAVKADQENADEIAATWREVHLKLTSVKCIKPIAEALSWLLQQGERINWNQNPYYTVFTNGVLQADKRHPGKPELYYFGPTTPEEYINDKYCMRIPFNCPPVAQDLGYLRKAEDLLENWFKVVQPQEDDRKLLLTYMSLSLRAKNHKKMIVNIGENGNNAKSSTFEFLIFILGSYGLVGDKNMIVKGTVDKVSVAKLNFVRFVLFEEPDPSKPFNVEFLKDLVGGAETIVGRLNYSNNNVVVLHCKTTLNANTMTQVKLEKAVEERLLYMGWQTIFTTKPAEVDHKKRIYKANPKFKTKQYWKEMGDGFIWLLLNHYRLFENNDDQLPISEDQFARTRSELMESDLFIKWFGANYVLLAATQNPRSDHQFVTVAEIQQEFKKLTPKEQQLIIGSKHYGPDKFITDIVKGHTALREFWRRKVTNWRLTTEERRKTARNAIGPNGQYQGQALLRFMPRAEFDMSFDGFLEQRLGMTDRAYEEQQQQLTAELLNDELLDDELLNDEQHGPHSQEEKDETLNDEPVKDQAARPDIKAADYIYSDELFFTYGADHLPEPASELQSDDDVEMGHNGSGDNTDNGAALRHDNEDKKDNEDANDNDNNNYIGAGVDNNSEASGNDDEDEKDNEDNGDNNDKGAGVTENSGAVDDDNNDNGGRDNNDSGAEDNNTQKNDDDDWEDIIMNNINNAEENATDNNDDDDDAIMNELSFSSFTTPNGSMVGFNADTGSTGSNSASLSGHKRIRITHKAGEEARRKKKQRKN